MMEEDGVEGVVIVAGFVVVGAVALTGEEEEEEGAPEVAVSILLDHMTQ